MNRESSAAVAFQNAVNAADAAALRAAFSAHPDLVEVIDAPWFSFDSPALVHAAGSRDQALLDALLDLGADPEARSVWAAGPYTALHRLVDGATEESLRLAEHLTGRGALIDLHGAAGLGRQDRIEEILDAEPQRVSEPGPDGATPLHLARNVEVAALLLERGADIDKRCVDHTSTPAQWAVQGREEVMRFLLDQGARPDLFQAVLLDDVTLIDSILEAEPTAIDVRVRFGETPEHIGGDKYVWALGGADSPLELARMRGAEAAYQRLLRDSSPAALLLQASRREDRGELTRLLANGPSAIRSLAESDVAEILHGSAAGAEAMMRAGADPNSRGSGGTTALHHAAWRGSVELGRVLLEGGADAGIREDSYDATALGWANENGQTEMMDLIQAYWEPDIVDASWLGLSTRVAAILSARPETVDGYESGRISPLRSAAWCGHADVVRVLLDYGADPSLRHPKSGQTALDFALQQGHEDIVALLSPR